MFCLGFGSSLVLLQLGFRNQMTGNARNGYTVVPDRYSIETIRRALNDAATPPQSKTAYIYEIFAHHISLSCDSSEVYAVLQNTNWLNEVEISLGPDINSEKWFMDYHENATVFTIDLYKSERFSPPRRILFTLSGKGLTIEDARLFFQGKLARPVELIQFALRFPHAHKLGSFGRTEIFSEWRISVRDEL